MGAKLKPMKKLNLLNPTAFDMLESEIIREDEEKNLDYFEYTFEHLSEPQYKGMYNHELRYEFDNWWRREYQNLSDEDKRRANELMDKISAKVDDELRMIPESKRAKLKENGYERNEGLENGSGSLEARMLKEVEHIAVGNGEITEYEIDNSQFILETEFETYTFMFSTADEAEKEAIEFVTDNIYGVDKQAIRDVLGINEIDGVELDLVDEKDLIAYFDANPEQAQKVGEYVFDVKGYEILSSYDGIVYEFNFNGTDYVMYRWD